MPNWVPQSPTWLSRSTRWPRNSSTRARQSPMIVERRWPTCISLAMLGLEKSTSTGAAISTAGTPSRGSPRRLRISIASCSGLRLRLMKPGPAIWGVSQRWLKAGFAVSCATMAVAIWRGGCPSGLARARAPLAWKSPNSGLLAGPRAGSRGWPWARAVAASSGKAWSIAARSCCWRLSAMRSMGRGPAQPLLLALIIPRRR